MEKYGWFENDRASKLSNDPKSWREDKPRRRSQNNSVGAFAKTPLFPHLRNGFASETIDQPRSTDLIFFPHTCTSFWDTLVIIVDAFTDELSFSRSSFSRTDLRIRQLE